MWTSFPKLAGWWLQVFGSAYDNIIYPVTAQMTSCEYYLMPPQNHPWKNCSCLWIRSSHSLPLKYNPQMSFSLLKTNARYGNTVIVANYHVNVILFFSHHCAYLYILFCYSRFVCWRGKYLTSLDISGHLSWQILYI